MIQIFKVENIPLITTEEEIWQSLHQGLKDVIEEGDILIVAHTPFSRVRGPKYKIGDMIPSDVAIEFADSFDKDPKKVEVILKSSRDIIKMERGIIISENQAGVICANAGVDESNAGIGYAIGVPDNPDEIALEVRNYVKDRLSTDIAVIVTDTVGRALRRGAVNIGIGCSGIPSIRSEIGKKDLFGYTMKVSQIAVIDEIASAAELVQGQTNEGAPFVIVRGYRINFEGLERATILNRPENERLFK